MGWHINLEKNTVKINSEIALALYNSGADVCFCWRDECSFPMLEGVINGGKLVFNSDHMEHMDYVWDPQILEVLQRFKVKGDICFSSNDGDNRGQKWGYRFDGEGGMVKLKGKAIYSEAPKPKKAAKPKKAKADWRDHVKHVIDWEGFDYAFQYKTDFPEVKDKKFHELRKAYCDAAQALKDYIGPLDE